MADAYADGSRWIPIAAEVLDIDPRTLSELAGGNSFTALGGTSLRAAEYRARMARECGRDVSLRDILGAAPFTEAATGSPVPAAAAAPRADPADGESGNEAARVQQGILLADELRGPGQPSSYHLLFSADITGPLDAARLKAVLRRLTARHAALRTVFARDPGTGLITHRAVAGWQPPLIEQQLPPLPPGDSPVEAVHRQLAPAARNLLRPYEKPPAAFILTRVSAGHAVLSLLAHHAVLDGWSIGLLWREIAAQYAGERGEPRDRAVPEAARPAASDAARRAAALAGYPDVVEIPSDSGRPGQVSAAGSRLGFSLSGAARDGCEKLARDAGVTRNTVLLGAWALVIARRAAAGRFLLGVAHARRATAAAMSAVGCHAAVMPVTCDVRDSDTVRGFLRATAGAVADALASGDVPLEEVVAALGGSGDGSRSPLVQIGFSAHDELIPGELRAGDVTFRLAEGHCGGSGFDACLYVQRWAVNSPVLAIEYLTAALGPGEAARLARALDAALADMAAAPDAPLADVRTMPASEKTALLARGAGPAAAPPDGIWQLFDRVAQRRPGAAAIRDANGAVVTYRQLRDAAAAQSAALLNAGVTEGDCVAVCVRRSAREIVALLAILRAGAAYTGLETTMPPPMVASVLDAADVKVVLGDEGRLAALGASLGGRAALPILPATTPAPGPAAPPPAPPDPARAAYIAFTSGSTGAPKGTAVPCRGVARLAHQPGYLRDGACERFLRLAPLAFDASTLEIFAPLLAGGTLEVFPGTYVAPDELADFLQARAVTGLWLTSGLFRLVADYRPDSFRGARQLLTGGDVVPPAQVARVLSACPGLRVTNGYGPTENTTFTAVFHLDDPAQATAPLPVGTPIQGTGVVILDDAGRMVPDGGIGELCAYGQGLAGGYIGMPAETARAFGPFSPDLPERLYRTGDLARWDADGNLRFCGRRDQQVKIRGFRVEPDQIARVLRRHPAVDDCAVLAVPGESGDRRLLAAVVAAAPGIAAELRAHAGAHLPGYAVPALWAVVPELPLTANGKLDAARLAAIAAGRPPGPPPAAPGTDREAGQALVAAVADVWELILGHRNFGPDDDFYAAGGDSLNLLRMHAVLSRRLPGCAVTAQDLFASRTIAAMAARLDPQRRLPSPARSGTARPENS